MSVGASLQRGSSSTESLPPLEALPAAAIYGGDFRKCGGGVGGDLLLLLGQPTVFALFFAGRPIFFFFFADVVVFFLLNNLCNPSGAYAAAAPSRNGWFFLAFPMGS